MLKAALSYVAEGFSVDIRATDSNIVANHSYIRFRRGCSSCLCYGCGFKLQNQLETMNAHNIEGVR